jgi:hypothetical protein
MMNLYIQVREGQPWQHPILEDNLVQAFPGIDLNNLPPGFARFLRIVQPSPDAMPVGHFQVAECTYELMEDRATYHDKWAVREMTDAEKSVATKTRVNQNKAILEDLKVLGQSKADETTGDVQTAWQEYVSVLNSLVITDPFEVTWPNMPKFDDAGNLITQ